MAENHESIETIELAIQKFNEKNGEIATLNSQVNTLTSTVNTLNSQVATDNTNFGNIYEAIVIKGGAESCTENDHSTYASGILSIDTYSGDVDALKGYLDNVYTVLSQNTVRVTVVSGEYSTYDDAIQNIYNAYDLIISGKDSTISGLEGYLDDVYTQIVAKGGTCTQKDYSTYDEGVASIPTSGGDTSQLEGYLSDIYTVINANKVGVTCTSGVYGDYDDAIQNIYNAYDNTITDLQGQISTLNSQINTLTAQVSSLQNQLNSRDALINELQGYLSDIYSQIIAKGGTCTQNDYSTYDDGVASISSATPSGVASLDDLKSQLTGIDADGDLVITNGRYLFANMPKFGKFFINKFDLSNCTDVTGMFENISCGFNGLSDFGSNVQSDLVLDLRSMSVDLDHFKDDIARNNTGYRREIILKHDDYGNNVGWGGVKTLTDKGYIITDAGEDKEE